MALERPYPPALHRSLRTMFFAMRRCLLGTTSSHEHQHGDGNTTCAMTPGTRRWHLSIAEQGFGLSRFESRDKREHGGAGREVFSVHGVSRHGNGQRSVSAHSIRCPLSCSLKMHFFSRTTGDMPVWVCTAANCSSIRPVGEISTEHYHHHQGACIGHHVRFSRCFNNISWALQ
jgi:hypothetical protein